MSQNKNKDLFNKSKFYYSGKIRTLLNFSLIQQKFKLTIPKYSKKKRNAKIYILAFVFYGSMFSQNPLYTNISVSDVGINNNIGKANTSRNIAIDNSGNIYVVFTGSEGTRVAKSTNRGASFLPSISVTPYSSEPEIAVSSQGYIFVSWVENNNIKLSKSEDQGVTFSPEITVGTADPSEVAIELIETVHIATYGSNIYISDRSGENIYVNTDNGIGSFSNINLPNFAYSDILTDLNGTIYAPRDNPSLDLFKSIDNGDNFTQIDLSSLNNVYYSSYTLSDGPCGTFIFVAGSGSDGYKIDVADGSVSQITFGSNDLTFNARTLFADSQGTIIDGYQNLNGELVMSVSFNQGDTFNAPIVIANGDSHNIDRNTAYNDVVTAYASNGQIFVSVYDDVLKSINITAPNPSIELCSTEDFTLSFELTGIFDPNTNFAVILSDSSGSFENSITLENVVTNSDTTITLSLPLGLPASDDYRLLVESLADCTQSQPISIILGNFEYTEPIDLFGCADSVGVDSFDLSQNTSVVLQNQAGYDISYHISENDANNFLNPIPNIANYESGTSTIWMRIQNSGADSCYIVTDFEITVYELPNNINTIALQECDIDQNQDGFTIFNLTEANSLISELTDYDYSYFTSLSDAEEGLQTNEITDPNSYTNTISGSETIYIRVVPLDATTTDCFHVIPLIISVNSLSDIYIADEYVICLSNNDMVVPATTNTFLPKPPIDTQLSSSEYDFQWYNGTEQEVLNNPNSFLISGEMSASYYPMEAGNYTVLITDKDTNCVFSKSTMVVDSYPPESIMVEQTSGLFLDNTILEVSVIGNGDYEYRLENGVWQSSSIFENVSGGEQIIYVRDLYNCNLLMVAKSIIDYPLFFTPNDDDKNDRWNIRNIADLPNAKIYIFDRYGKLLKELSAFENGWDGMYNGNKMPVSDYWFSVEYNKPSDGTMRIFRSHFTLKR
ncbi:T9SS type B sorting domain-containing protein [Sediminibacter sp. Hel_I_10]|uniref:T9SS type B sorting domain-containing protein n=1 Tax=Sediminibacter sp. Hel_I_10 TaxID=1392490 RepID=UPI00047B8E11|nr:T9SS type B sorting domain-containing protein [Sediminibacter sp. Hel_I_10]